MVIDKNIDFTNIDYRIEIILVEKDYKKITDMSYMFYDCKSLLYLTNSTFDTINVKNMQYMFYNCISLESLNCISKWNISNVTNLSYMFYGCLSLSTFPDTSNWNTTNVADLSYMFYNCPSLKNLPDITKWNLTNVIHMNNIFYYYYKRKIFFQKMKSCCSISFFCLLIWIIILFGIVTFFYIEFSGIGFRNLVILLFIPYYLFYGCLFSYDIEKYINNPLYHNYFIEINGNEFQNNKNDLTLLNFLSSIFYTFYLVLPYLYSYHNFIKRKHLLCLLYIILIFLILFDSLNIIIFKKLNELIKNFENKLNSLPNQKEKLNFKNFTNEAALAMFNIMMVIVIPCKLGSIMGKEDNFKINVKVNNGNKKKEIIYNYFDNNNQYLLE